MDYYCVLVSGRVLNWHGCLQLSSFKLTIDSNIGVVLWVVGCDVYIVRYIQNQVASSTSSGVWGITHVVLEYSSCVI